MPISSLEGVVRAFQTAKPCSRPAGKWSGWDSSRTRPAWIGIRDEQFRVGLFPDIERAIARPDEAVEKGIGAYIVHRDYSTSQEINALLAAGQSELFVKAHDVCWRLTIHNR